MRPTFFFSRLALISRGELHEASPPLVLDLVGHRRLLQRVGRGTLDRGVLEAADAVELGAAQPVEQLREILLRFRREIRR